jgi:hypothetical protein
VEMTKAKASIIAIPRSSLNEWIFFIELPPSLK